MKKPPRNPDRLRVGIGGRLQIGRHGRLRRNLQALDRASSRHDTDTKYQRMGEARGWNDHEKTWINRIRSRHQRLQGSRVFGIRIPVLLWRSLSLAGAEEEETDE